MSDALSPTVTVYWRPGCPYCSMLSRDLDRVGLPYEAHNIWDEPDAAAFVRSVARDNETVPTVTVGDTALVNPSIDAIVALLQSAQAQHSASTSDAV